MPHCQDRSDELECSEMMEGCDHQCDDESRCVPKTFLCDGERDCQDGSDEANCGMLSHAAILPLNLIGSACVRHFCDIQSFFPQKWTKNAAPQSLNVPAASVCPLSCVAMVIQIAGTDRMRRAAPLHKSVPPNNAALRAKSV